MRERNEEKQYKYSNGNAKEKGRETGKGMNKLRDGR